MREKKSMAISSWFCSNNTKNMLVKIVHPGGHVELHDRPVTAADIVRRNPKCCVAYPNVFKQPWAIVAPDTTLMPGQKFYVVPISTVRKLQLLSKKYSPALLQEIETIQNAQNNRESYGKASTGGKINKNDAAQPTYSCPKQFNNNGRGIISGGNKEGEQIQPKELASCCARLRKGTMIKARTEDKSKETTSSNSCESSENLLTKNRHNKDLEGSPKRLSSFDQWHPSLKSITEEY